MKRKRKVVGDDEYVAIAALLNALIKVRNGYREDIERWREAEADVDALIAATRAAFPSPRSNHE